MLDYFNVTWNCPQIPLNSLLISYFIHSESSNVKNLIYWYASLLTKPPMSVSVSDSVQILSQIESLIWVQLVVHPPRWWLQVWRTSISDYACIPTPHRLPLPRVHSRLFMCCPGKHACTCMRAGPGAVGRGRWSPAIWAVPIGPR